MEYTIKFVLFSCQLNKSEVKECLAIGALVKGETPKNKDVKYCKTNPISFVFSSKMRVLMD